MPKYYCDYCDTYLTHDSPSVRKTHNSGRKHKDNVKFYYTKWMEEQAQHLIDQTIKQAEKSAKTPQAMSGMQPGMPPMPLPPPGVPMPPGMMIPGMIMPPGMPPVPAPGLPPVPPAGVVGSGPDSNTPKSTSSSNTAMPPDSQSVRPGVMPMRPGGPLGSMGPGALPPGGPRSMMPGPGGPGNMGSGVPQRNQGQQRSGNMGSQNPPGMQRPHGMSGDNSGLMRPPHMRPPPMSDGMHNGYAPQGGPPHHQGQMPDRPPSYRR